jgi:putative ABC transport system permease protein
MMWFSLAWRSAWSRKQALAMVMLSVSVSVLILLGVQQLREDAKRSFSNALSGVDLIVGPRGSATELMLYSVFQIGRPSRNMGYEGYTVLAQLPQVQWAVPIQLGDSYMGHPVLGSTPEIFNRFKSQGQGLQWAHGRAFADPLVQPEALSEVVLGAEVAKRFGHKLNDKLVLTHGQSSGLGTEHEDHPMTVVGILAPTGAPIDRSVIVSLQAFEAIHVGWGMGISPSAFKAAGGAQQALDIKDLQPSSLSAVWVGLHNRAEVFSVRRKIESLERGQLMAVMPGVALDELWQIVKVVENTLLLVGMLVAVSAMFSVAAVLLVAMAGRRKELAILRAMGAAPLALMGFVLLESLLVCVVGIVTGYVLCQALLIAGQGVLRTEFGVLVQAGWPAAQAWWALAGLCGVALVASLVPAWRAYRLSLSDGLHPPSV